MLMNFVKLISCGCLCKCLVGETVDFSCRNATQLRRLLFEFEWAYPNVWGGGKFLIGGPSPPPGAEFHFQLSYERFSCSKVMKCRSNEAATLEGEQRRSSQLLYNLAPLPPLKT